MGLLDVFKSEPKEEEETFGGVKIPDAEEEPNTEASPTLPDANTTSNENSLGGVKIPDADGNEEGSGEERSTFENVVEGVKAGAREAVAPFSMTGDERKKALGSSKAAMAAYVLSNLGTGIAAGAAAGSALPGLGTALGAGAGTAKALATVGPALYAVYAGLGRDRLRSQDEHQEWDPLSGKGLATAAITTGLELNPLIKSADKSAAILRAALQVAGEGANEALHGGSKSDVAVASVMGLLGAAAVAKNVAGAGKISEELVGDVAESMADSGAALAPKALARLKNEDINLPTEVAKVPSAFKRSVVGDISADLSETKLDEAYSLAMKNASPEAAKRIQDDFVNYKFGNILTDETEKYTQELQKGFKATEGMKDITKLDEWVNPVMYVAKAVDKVTGLETMKLYDKMQQSRHAYAQVNKMFAENIYKLRRTADKLGLSGEDVFDLVEGRSNASLAAAAKKYGEANLLDLKTRVTEHTDKMLGFLREKGYDVARREGYMLQKAKKAPELALEVDNMADAIRAKMKELSASTIGELRAKVGEEGDEVLDALDALSRRRLGHNLEHGADIGRLKASILQGQPMGKVTDYENEISALFARRGAISQRLQERNAWELLSAYSNENLRAAMYDDALKYGQLMTKALDVAGMKRASDFFNRYIADNMGNRWGLDGAMKNLATRMEYEGTKLARDAQSGILGRAAGNAVKAAPEFAAWLNNQIYPAKLAFNIPGAIRNYTQFVTNTVPEVGWGYGGEVGLRAAMATIKDAGNMKNKLKALNIVSDHFRGELENVRTMTGAVRHGIDQFNDAAMKFYSASDTVNRAISYNMGHEIAKDLIKGKAEAIKFIQKADPTLAQMVKRSLKEGASKEAVENIGDAVGRYLVSKTQYDFGKAAQSQALRALGPAFSMFTTWPVNITADVVHQFRDGGAKQGFKQVATKYAAPYILLAAASAAMKDSSVGENPTYKYLIGKPTEYAPLASIAPSERKGRGMMDNPLVETVTGVAGPLFNEDRSPGERIKASAGKALDAAATSYMPVVSPIVNEANRVLRIYQGQSLTDRAKERLGLK